MKYRVKFTKEDGIQYIGHLDVMRLFQRAIKRAGLPVAYSQGFNPHQLIAFANPLSLGMTSGGEYGDFEMAEEVVPEELVSRLNAVLPEEVHVLLAVPLMDGAKKAMADVSAALYAVAVPSEDVPELLAALPMFLAQKEILVMKKTKNNYKETDIRPDLFCMEFSGENVMTLFLAAGSLRNVKAELVMDSLYQFAGRPFPKYRLKYRRQELYRQEEDGTYVPLYCGVERL